METLESKKDTSNSDFDIVIIVSILWKKRKFLLISVLSFVFLGILAAFTAPNYYKSETSFITQSNQNANNNLNGLASLAGIDLSQKQSSNEIPLSLYPKFAASVVFRLKLLDAPLFGPSGLEKVTYEEYYDSYNYLSFSDILRKYTIGLPGVLLGFIKGESLLPDGRVNEEESSSIIRLNSSERDHINRISEQLVVELGDEDGLIKLSFEMPDPVYAAQMANYASKLLQEELIAYKIRKAKEDLVFTKKLFVEKELEFEKAQTELSAFLDRNQSLSSAMARNRELELQSRFDLARNIYLDLAKQFEQAKLKVKSDTPIFSFIDPVVVPKIKAGPNRLATLVLYALVGVLLSVLGVLVKEFVRRLNFLIKKQNRL